MWQARRESNPQPAVLETAALPIELLAYLFIYFANLIELPDGNARSGQSIIKE